MSSQKETDFDYEFGCDGTLTMPEANEMLHQKTDWKLNQLVSDGMIWKKKQGAKKNSTVMYCRRSIREYIASCPDVKGGEFTREREG